MPSVRCKRGGRRSNIVTNLTAISTFSFIPQSPQEKKKVLAVSKSSAQGYTADACHQIMQVDMPRILFQAQAPIPLALVSEF